MEKIHFGFCLFVLEINSWQAADAGFKLCRKSVTSLFSMCLNVTNALYH